MNAKATSITKTVSHHRPRVAGSMADQIDQLDVHHSVSVSERFDVGSHKAGGGDILDALKRLRSGQAAYVARITDVLDTRKFKVESGTFLTDDKTGIIATVVVTRME